MQPPHLSLSGLCVKAGTKAEREEVAELRAHVSREMTAKHDDMLSTTVRCSQSRCGSLAPLT